MIGGLSSRQLGWVGGGLAAAAVFMASRGERGAALLLGAIGAVMLAKRYFGF